MVDFRFEQIEAPHQMSVGVESVISAVVDLTDIPVFGPIPGENCTMNNFIEGKRARVGAKVVDADGNLLGRGDNIYCFGTGTLQSGRRLDFPITPGTPGDASVVIFARLLGTDVEATSKPIGVEVLHPEDTGGGEDGCSSDIECPGDFVCDNGECVPPEDKGKDKDIIDWAMNNPLKGAVVAGTTVVLVKTATETVVEETV